ncbi:(2Fe-2S)-binding protein [Sulfitobacter pseudonitzschiae]|nr:(2Fe-2S)-binding protein [Pseudosulfitobacter pseudonitzschiae]MBM1835028.1 (2Fe-2S)-binding protein [Pseudosulfitobacter pseudonitzschiae]MBM1839829.1 (2Fe-2S)-binding protein [Pseudosulfitobacter pseudonitzschiae]MBM1844755.1 (2Fe-2S)-binding protein [Pseudosulfitobacter pseudonitzschiae]MBM1849558.1 (2Fe-2S)-binding protein [Pseudosulfitobacter pseudonitzschiae]
MPGSCQPGSKRRVTPRIWRYSVKPASRFRELPTASDKALVDVRFGAQALRLPLGENLAAALLVAGIMPFRQTPVSGAPRGPFCMMGACFDCLVEIDGVTRQACMLTVTRDMAIDMPAAGKGDGDA